MCDDREEGEIVDDEFEDISDNSIILPSGKSLSPKDHLRALCLSSGSDCAPEPPPKRIRRRLRNRKRRRSHRKISCVKINEVDSDLDLEYDRLLQQKLKAAVHIDDNEELQKNSLRTRLMKGMSNDDKDNDMDSSINEQDTESINVVYQNTTSSPKSGTTEPCEDNESELIQLRMEALRTTLVNKYKNKKKPPKKINETPDINNKENTNLNPEVIIETSVPDEDEDVLRAKLLASMSKQLLIKSAEQPIQNLLVKKRDTTTFVNNNNNNFKRNQLISKNKIVRNFNNNQDIKIAPIIISLNSNSDSEEEPSLNTELVIPKTIDKLVIESTVEKFLLEEREKVEAEKYKKSLIEFKSAEQKNSENLNVMKSQDNQKTKVQSALKLTPKNVQKRSSATEFIEKSAVKLLPKSKQIEYQRLLLQLKNAQKNGASNKIPPKNPAQKLVADNKQQTTTKGLEKSKAVKTKATKSVNGKYGMVRSEAVLLQTTIKGMQTVINKRLQIKSQYKTLKPLLARISDTRKDQKKYEQDVKRLTEELAEAKRNQMKTHEQFSLHLKQLVKKKQEIDKGTLLAGNNNKARFTSSTPVKERTIATPLELSSISKNNNSLTLVEQPKFLIPNDFDNNMVIEDPNDIDRVINRANYLRQNTVDVAPSEELFMEYSSPLDMVKSGENVDPLSILCPFDVDGTCRDKDCTYKHFLKR